MARAKVFLLALFALAILSLPASSQVVPKTAPSSCVLCSENCRICGGDERCVRRCMDWPKTSNPYVHAGVGCGGPYLFCKVSEPASASAKSAVINSCCEVQKEVCDQFCATPDGRKQGSRCGQECGRRNAQCLKDGTFAWGKSPATRCVGVSVQSISEAVSPNKDISPAQRADCEAQSRTKYPPNTLSRRDREKVIQACSEGKEYVPQLRPTNNPG